ncbi:hypothetical protein [Candidatus Poriferisodalis sp.]|uniref:hypothetical protein n=1 Tax=Candidatus Poriferisodalis sp. TaxID=3101277 RepID=UPI003B52A87E
MAVNETAPARWYRTPIARVCRALRAADHPVTMGGDAELPPSVSAPLKFRSGRERAAYLVLHYGVLLVPLLLVLVGSIGVVGFIVLSIVSYVAFDLGWRLWRRRSVRH